MKDDILFDVQINKVKTLDKSLSKNNMRPLQMRLECADFVHWVNHNKLEIFSEDVIIAFDQTSLKNLF